MLQLTIKKHHVYKFKKGENLNKMEEIANEKVKSSPENNK